MSFQEDYERMKLFNRRAVPDIAPIFGYQRIAELDDDYNYLKYLYPKSAREIGYLVEDYADRLEYDGSVMFDQYPDQVTLRSIVADISRKYREKNKDATYNEFLDYLIAVMFYHEVLYRRNRYRNRKRLYF